MRVDLGKYIQLLRIKEIDGKKFVFDPPRKKWVTLSPEEMVRQSIILYLVNEKKYSPGLMSVEKAIEFNTMVRRYDLVIYNRKLKPWILVECKSPDTALDENILRQVSVYNHSLDVPFIWLSNGHSNVLLKLNKEKGSFERCEELPESS